MGKMPLSVAMVVYNDGEVLDRALASVVDVASEILVVHDGPCADDSLVIASRYGARIFEREHVGIAEPHRAWLLQQTSYNWILQLDADEYVSTELRDALPRLLSAEDVACYELIWPNWDGTKYTTHNWPHKKALFRKDKIEFLALPHSEVQPLGKTLQVPYVLEHKPHYDNLAWSSFQKKWRRWIHIHATYLLKDPSTYDRYPVNAEIKVPRYYAIVHHPYLLSIPLALYQAFQSFKSGGYKAGWRGVKLSVFIGLYYFYLALEVAHLESLPDLF